MASWDSRVVTNEHLLPYIDSNTAAPEIKAALKTLPFERNIFKLLANGSVSFGPFMALLSSMWHEDRKIRATEWQTAVLRTAAMLDAPYEWDVNEPVARVFSFTEEQLMALRRVDSSLPEECFTLRQRLIGDMIGELCSGNKVSIATMNAVASVFSAEELMEVFFTHGVYAFLARTMNSCLIDFDEPIPDLLGILSNYNRKAIEKEESRK